MRSRDIILAICMVLLSLPVFAGDTGLTTQDMHKVMEKARQYQGSMKLPQTVSHAMKKAAQQANRQYNSPGYQALVRQYTESIRKQLEKDNPQIQGYKKLYSRVSTRNTTSILLPSERVYIFISSSVPMATLREYAAGLDKLGDPDVFMVMRGFVGGIKHVKETLDFMRQVLDLDFDAGTGLRATVEIDPLLFRRYNIGRVPAVVFANGVSVFDREASEGLEDNAIVRDSYVVYGDMSLKYDLYKIYRETGNPRILELKRKLERGFYR